MSSVSTTRKDMAKHLGYQADHKQLQSFVLYNFQVEVYKNAFVTIAKSEDIRCVISIVYSYLLLKIPTSSIEDAIGNNK